ncbi:MAG: hypothetical protein Q8S44_09615 [Flavobacteriaceae bacterium]|nr:hypothetical protein [Flavobacteriaceae bacterium]
MIKVGYLVSYDYSMFLTSVKQLYNYVNKVYIAIDKGKKTWSGNKFEIPDSFFNEVKQFDIKNKVEFYFDNFYVHELTPIECETRERNLLLKKMGKGWKIQLDVDEYIYDFKTVSKYLKKYWYLTLFPKLTPIVFRGKLVTLYRLLPDGYLYIENNERFSFITNQSNYTYTRNNNTVRNHFTNINVIHQSWARSEDEIQLKINNWGHRDDFDTKSYFMFWKSLNRDNYKEYKNIHPLSPVVWNELNYLQSNSINEFINKYSIKNKQVLIPISKSKIFKSAIKKILGRV